MLILLIFLVNNKRTRFEAYGPVLKALGQRARGLGFDSPTGQEKKPWTNFTSCTASLYPEYWVSGETI
jgi:hypothetical protein